MTLSGSYGLATPAWDGTISLPLFNTASGTLTGVVISATGNVSGTAGCENKTPSGAVVSMTLGANVVVKDPRDGITSLLTASPTADASPPAPLGAWDLTLDFGGTSGWTSGTLTGSNQQTSAPLTGSLSFFQGTSTFNLPVSAVSTSVVSGPGKMVSYVDTQAGASVTVTYTFTPVPEPGTLALLGVGTLGLAWLGWRKKRHRGSPAAA